MFDFRSLIQVWVHFLTTRSNCDIWINAHLKPLNTRCTIRVQKKPSPEGLGFNGVR